MGSAPGGGGLTKPVHLSRRGGELLLRLLEQSRPAIAATAVEELPSETRSALINAGALVRHGAGRAVLAAGDDGPTFRDLAWQAGQNAYGYFDASDGSVVLAPESQMLFRVALPWWLAWLAVSLALTNSSQPTELVPASAWDIGDLWITRQRKVAVLFARRLSRDAQFGALQAALAKRRGRSGGLIFTSSGSPLRNSIEDPPYRIVPIFDVLTNDNEKFAIDRFLALSPYVPAAKVSGVTVPIYLSPDGRTLVINGRNTVDFKSARHIAIIQSLVAGHGEGRRFRASKTPRRCQIGRYHAGPSIRPKEVEAA